MPAPTARRGRGGGERKRNDATRVLQTKNSGWLAGWLTDDVLERLAQWHDVLEQQLVEHIAQIEVPAEEGHGHRVEGDQQEAIEHFALLLLLADEICKATTLSSHIATSERSSVVIY